MDRSWSHLCCELNILTTCELNVSRWAVLQILQEKYVSKTWAAKSSLYPCQQENERIRLPLANARSISKKGNTVACAPAKYSLLPPLPSPFHAGIWTVENWVSLVTRILSYTHLNQLLYNIFKSFRRPVQLVQSSTNVFLVWFWPESYFSLCLTVFCFAVLESNHAFR